MSVVFCVTYSREIEMEKLVQDHDRLGIAGTVFKAQSKELRVQLLKDLYLPGPLLDFAVACLQNKAQKPRCRDITNLVKGCHRYMLEGLFQSAIGLGK